MREQHGATPTTWYEKNMLLEDLMTNVNSNTSGEDVDNLEGDTMNGLDENEIGGMHGNTTNDIFGDANINEHVLGQEGRKLNDPYTFVDKEEFNARFGPRGKVHFVQLLTSEGYWEGLHFKPSQESDVVITKLTDFGPIGNVGHMNTIKTKGVEVTIKPKAIERMDQPLAMEYPINVPLMHALKNLQVASDELYGPQHPPHNINNTLYTTPTIDGDVGLSRIIPIES